MLKSDIRRYRYGGFNLKSIFYMISLQGIWAITVYRFGSWCGTFKFPVLGFILRFIYFLLFKIIEVMSGISISSGAQIGGGIYIGHFGGIFINEGARIGENLTIAQGVTIGTLGLGKRGSPVIGNNVFIGSGAKVLGDIRVGDNVRIGANAVVVGDIPANATVVGVPAHIVKIRDKNGAIETQR